MKLATLTGAIMVALGKETAGLYSNDDKLKDNLLAAGKTAEEPLWHMPITNEHRENMKRKVADMNNLGTNSWGGSCKAAAFLEMYLEKYCGEDGSKAPAWAHLDIAGPAMPYGVCTGFGAHLILRYLTGEK